MQKSKAGLFLMELLIALLFFAITGAVCLSLFVGAHNTNDLSENRSRSSVLLTNLGERFYNSDSLEDINGTYFYDRSLRTCDESRALYRLVADAESADGYTSLHVVISDPSGDSVFIEQDLIRYERRRLNDVSEN